MAFSALIGINMLNESKTTSNSARSNPVRVATNYLKGSQSLDPVNIANVQEYELVRNLYGRLIEYNTQGELMAGIPQSFNWEGKRLIFHFAQKVRTIGGNVVGAEDAARSLKRAIMFRRTGHGDLRNFLCPEFQLKSLEDKCPGIEVQGERLILTPIHESMRPHLLAVLESADFSIIPLESLNPNPREPTLLNHRNTSGPYYVDSDKDSGAWQLKANPNHYLYNQEMPSTIELVPVSTMDTAEMLEKGIVDIIPTSVYFSGSSAVRILNQRTHYNVHESMPIRVLMACFTPRAINEFSVQQRFFAGATLAKFMNTDFFSLPGRSVTIEFFQGLSDGSLNDGQKMEIKQLRASQVRPAFTKPITIGATGPTYDLLVTFLKDYPEISAVKTPISAYLMPMNERPDIYVVSSDAAWTESVSLLGHNFEVGIFQLPDVDGDRWIKAYAATEDRAERISKLQDLHYNLLKSAVIYPTFVSPYYAVANHKWRLPFSTFSAGTELWKIRPAQ
ncbi:MAG: hypothetical protein KF799_15575 [Bdellovibrionales bacterium]|nr:hypothetical protein [Bdellovibrionales bacterium]